MTKIFKWTGIIVLTIVAGVSIVTASRQHIKYEAPYPAIKASGDIKLIERGKHLVYAIAHCADCHSTANVDSLLEIGQEVSLTGGRVFALPLGNIYTKNITSDKETGIGNYSDEEIARALRYGVHRDGTAVFDFMPFHNISDEDMTAIISYLRTQKPVRNEVPEHDLNVLGNVVNAFMVKPVGPSEKIAGKVIPDTTVEYGGYIVNNIANCSGCHTKRDMKGGAIGEPFAGGAVFTKEGFEPLTAPNITPHASSRIYGWSQDAFIKRFRMGKVIPHSEMPWNSFKRMTDDELKAIYKYLQTVKPAKTYVEKS